MSDNLALDEVWNVYEGTRDCIKITERILRSGDARFTRRTNFVGSTEDEAEKRLQESRREMDGFVIVLLWAQFERSLIEFVQERVQKLSEESPVALAENLHAKVKDAIEFWRTSDLLELFKGTVDATVIGTIKQIKEYRDWVVHRNPNKEPSAKTDPGTAYRVLSQVVTQLAQLTDQGKGTPATG
jgi:hypothetical protein